MTRKIVKSATVEPVNIFELKANDHILWGRYKILIKSVDIKNRIVVAEPPIDELPRISAYYRILSCVEERPNTICLGCGTTIPSWTEYYEEFCTPKCKDKYDEVVERGEIYG